jgi:hypothetical protein
MLNDALEMRRAADYLDMEPDQLAAIAQNPFTDTSSDSFQLNGGSFTRAAGWASMRRSDGSIVRFDWEVRDLTNGLNAPPSRLAGQRALSQ